MKSLPLLTGLLALSLLAACGKKGEGTATVTTGAVTTDEDGIQVPNEDPPNLMMIRKAARETNIIRRRNNLPLLQFDPNLALVAQAQARDMSQNGRVQDTNRDGHNHFQRFRNRQVKFRRSGENIDRSERSPEEVIRRWMQNPEYRAKILDGQFRRQGIGYANGYWVQDFAD